MKKLLAFLMAVSLLLAMLTGCKSSEPAVGSETASAAAESSGEVQAVQETAAEPTPTGEELTPEGAQVLIEDYFDVWAIYLASSDGYMTFRCYNDYDPKTDRFDDYVGLVQIDTRTQSMTVLDGMTDDREKVEADPNVTAVPTESDAPVSATPTAAAETAAATTAAAATAAAAAATAAPAAKMFVSNVTVCCYLLANDNPTHLDIIDTIAFGTEVTVLDNTGTTFYKVSYNGKTGYVNKAYLVTTKPTKTYVVSSYMYVNNVDVACYLLDDPTTKNVLNTVYLGTQVGVIDKSDSSYYLVDYKGQVGYISASYLTATAPASTVKATKDMYVVNVNISCYLWSDANGTTAVDTIPLGTKVGIVERANDTFYRVIYGDQVGYVNEAYLSDNPPAAATATPAPATATPAAATATPAPTETAAPAPATAEPTATAAPSATAEPTAAPTATAEPTAQPTAEPEPSTEPTAEPEPSAEPEPTTEPEPTVEPEPEPTPEPEAEPYYSDAKELSANAEKSGRFEETGEKDHYVVEVDDGTVSLTFTPENPMSIGDIVIEVYDADGSRLASTESTGSQIKDDGDGHLKGSFSAPAGKLYINCYLKYGTDLSYTIKVG